MKLLLTILFLVSCTTNTSPRTTTTIGALDTSSDSFIVIHTLTSAEGLAVRGSPLIYNNRLYLTTGERGPNGDGNCSSTANWNTPIHRMNCPGSIVSMNLDGTEFQIEYAFNRLNVNYQNADGYHPYGSLSVDPSGIIHGVTQMGGIPTGGQPGEVVAGTGVEFSFNPKTKDFYTEHSFFATSRAFDGEYPMGIVTPVNDILFGVTKGGGNWPYAGTIWKLSNGNLTSVPAPGEGYGGLLYANGLLHGTTWTGGEGMGVYFTVDPSTLTVNVIDSFPVFPANEHGTDSAPIQTPTVMSDGTILAVRSYGGPFGTGIITKLDAKGIHVLKEFEDIPLEAIPRFSNHTGGIAHGTLVEGCDGLAYGITTYGGSCGQGTIFRIARDGTLFNVVYNFCGVHGYPYGGLTRGEDCSFYGTEFSTGVIFRFVPPTGCF